MTFYLFAAGLGFTWLATVPPTAAIVGKLFGIRYLATLFGLTLLSHQIGGFLGAYLGGSGHHPFGDFGWMWYADMALAALAARKLAAQPADPRSAGREILGRNTQVWDAVVTDEANGRKIALFRCTQMILWPKT
jgi:MFS family permease